MLAICGECKTENEKELLLQRSQRGKETVLLKCECGHEWEEDITDNDDESEEDDEDMNGRGPFDFFEEDNGEAREG